MFEVRQRILVRVMIMRVVTLMEVLLKEDHCLAIFSDGSSKAYDRSKFKFLVEHINSPIPLDDDYDMSLHRT